MIYGITIYYNSIEPFTVEHNKISSVSLMDMYGHILHIHVADVYRDLQSKDFSPMVTCSELAQ